MTYLGCARVLFDKVYLERRSVSIMTRNDFQESLTCLISFFEMVKQVNDHSWMSIIDYITASLRHLWPLICVELPHQLPANVSNESICITLFFHWPHAGSIVLIWFYAWPYIFLPFLFGLSVYFSSFLTIVEFTAISISFVINLREISFYKLWEGTGASSSLKTWYLLRFKIMPSYLNKSSIPWWRVLGIFLGPSYYVEIV